MKRYFWLFAVVILSIPSFITLLRPGMHNIQDDMQYFRIYEMNKCFDDVQIPCRWVPDMGFGFGYPLYIYYSPGPYYVGVLLHNLGLQYIDVVKLLFVSGFLVSGIAMYFLMKTLLSNNMVAFVSSMVYVYAPVRAVQVYVRGSLGEFLSMAIFPLLFLFTYRLVKNIGKYNILWLALAVCCQLLTHNLMSLAFFPILGFWTLLIMFLEKNYKATIKILWGFGLGFGMSAFFVVPIIFERSYVHLDSMVGGYFDYRAHFVNLYQLFISNHWGYGSSRLGPGDDLSMSVGQVSWILALVAVMFAIKKYRRDLSKSLVVLLLAGISLFIIFLSHERSAFIWEKFRILVMFQFPWRFLVISTFLLSILSGYFVSYLNDRIRFLLVLVVVGSLFVLYGSFFRPQRWLSVGDKELLSGSEFLKQQTASIFDYLPVSAVLPPNYKAPDYPEVISGKIDIGNYEKGSNYQRGLFDVKSDEAKVRLPLFDFPGMVVTDNKEPVYFDHSDCSNQDYCFGQISFTLKNGNHYVEVKLKSTRVRLVGDLLTLISFLGLLYCLIFKRSLLK